MYKQNFLNRRELSIDLSHRCALECPRCQRQFAFRDQGKKVPGRDITMDEIKKAAKFYNYFNFCGQLSDAVHHPQFIEILEYCNKKNIGVEIHNASSTKSKEWYIKAFKANKNARWVFGIDGLPEQSHNYRVHQDGVKLFNIMLEARKYLKQKPHWQYIIFGYNENNVDKAIQIAKDNNLVMILLNTSRWQSLNDPLMPKKKENVFIRKELYEKAKA